MKNTYKKGISFIEILIVLSVVIILVSVVFWQFSKIREQQVVKNGIADILSSINKARSQTLSSLNSSEYGVRFLSDRVIIFKGTTFPENAIGNETINIITPARITNVAFGCTLPLPCDVYFSRLYGVPSKTVTITISTSNFSKMITISATGSASVN